MQLLIDKNAKLMTDNSRLEIVVKDMRKSFQDFIKDSQMKSERDMKTIEDLKKENKLLQLKIKQQDSRVPSSRKLSCTSEHTPKTSPESSMEDLPLNIGSPQRSTQDSLVMDSIPELELNGGISGDDWIIEGEDIEELPHRAPRKKPMPRPSLARKDVEDGLSEKKPPSRSNSMPGEDLLVDFADNRRLSGSRRRALPIATARLTQSLTEPKQSEDLLVEFGTRGLEGQELQLEGRVVSSYDCITCIYCIDVAWC